MLAISRNVGQSVTIGGDITVKVYGVDGKKVKLAILAPREIPIVRDDAIDTTDEPNIEVQPGYHDKPTGPGLWICYGVPGAYGSTLMELTIDDIQAGYPLHTTRVYGPIPDDKGAEA